MPVGQNRLTITLLKVEKNARHGPPFLPATMPNIHRFKKKFTDRLTDKAFLIWFLKIPPHLKYVTTVPSNLLFITALVCDRRSFYDINVSQGSVATHMRCGEIFNNTLLQIYWRI